MYHHLGCTLIYRRLLSYFFKSMINTYLACSSDSRTKIPAPSPITKPSLASSKGREALSGVSLYTVDRALKCKKIVKKKFLIYNKKLGY